MNHQRLLTPGTIGPMQARNRVGHAGHGPEHLRRGRDHRPHHRPLRGPGSGEVGLLVLETSAVAWPVGATSIHQPALSDDRFVPGLARLADAVHAHGKRG